MSKQIKIWLLLILGGSILALSFRNKLLKEKAAKAFERAAKLKVERDIANDSAAVARQVNEKTKKYHDLIDSSDEARKASKDASGGSWSTDGLDRMRKKK